MSCRNSYWGNEISSSMASYFKHLRNPNEYLNNSLRTFYCYKFANINCCYS